MKKKLLRVLKVETTLPFSDVQGNSRIEKGTFASWAARFLVWMTNKISICRAKTLCGGKFDIGLRTTDSPSEMNILLCRALIRNVKNTEFDFVRFVPLAVNYNSLFLETCDSLTDLFLYLNHYSSQASSYNSPWQWTKVTATGEWHTADARKESAPNIPSSEMSAYLPGNHNSNNNNDYHNFQQLMNSNNAAGNVSVTKNRMPNMGLGINAGNNSAVNNNGGKSFQMPYPYLPPPQSQPLTAQNPLSPSNSSMLQPTMSNQSNLSVAQQQSMGNARNSFSLERVAGTQLESNNNQTSNQSNSTDQSSVQQQHNSMLSPTRHLPFPYSNLNNYHRNF